MDEKLLLNRGYKPRMFMGTKFYNGQCTVFVSGDNIKVKLFGHHHIIDTIEKLEAVEKVSLLVGYMK